jgi:hypothetical protein
VTSTIQLVVNVLAGGRASISNTAMITSVSADPVSANEIATIATLECEPARAW